MFRGLRSAPSRELRADFQRLGESFVDLYLMALNGAVCEPGSERCCDSCRLAWDQGRAVLDKYDPHRPEERPPRSGWGNMYRPGPNFQPFPAGEGREAVAPEKQSGESRFGVGGS